MKNLLTVSLLCLPFLGAESASAQETAAFSTTMTSGLQFLRSRNWQGAVSSFVAAQAEAGQIEMHVTDNPNMTNAEFARAATIDKTASCFFAIASVLKNANEGKYDNNIKTPDLASLCEYLLPQYALAAQQYQTEMLATIEQRRHGTLGDTADGAASQDCLATKYVPNDSCQTSDAVAIQIINNCHRPVHVQACIATNGPQPACGGYHIDDGAALTHYTCHGLMRFSVSEIR